MKRTAIINYLIQKNNYKSYLEIGIGNGKHFENIICDKKHSVDPFYVSTFKMRSDNFFSIIQDGWHHQTYDIIFIDGDHNAIAVWKDINNSLKQLNSGGIILVHDVNPDSPKVAKPEPKPGKAVWYGDGFKCIMRLRAERDDLFVRVIDTDCGVGIIKPVSIKQPTIDVLHYSYKSMNSDRKYFIGLISEKEFLALDI